MLSASQKQLIISIYNLNIKKIKANENNIDDYSKRHFYSFKLNWKDDYKELLSEKILYFNNEEFRISSSYYKVAKDLAIKYSHKKYWYNDWYRLADKSNAHSVFIKKY